MTGSSGLEGLEALSEAECGELLARSCVGRIGFVVGGRPLVLPVNHAADRSGTVVFRTSANSVLMAVAHQAVAFEIDGVDHTRRTGWSVLVQGQAREITEMEGPGIERLRAMPVVTWAPGRRDRWFCVSPDSISGRRLPMQGLDEQGWLAGILG